VIFYAQMAEEDSFLIFDDICEGYVKKCVVWWGGGGLIRRHPHVFPDGYLLLALVSQAYF